MALTRKYWGFNLYSAVPVPTQSSAVLVDPVGLEPTTSRLQGECSPNDELWAHIQTTVIIEVSVSDLFVLHNSNLRLASERTRAKLSCATLPQAVVCLMRPTLTLFPLLIWRCFCRANRGGDSTEARTPISSVKGWPPDQLEDGTI